MKRRISIGVTTALVLSLCLAWVALAASDLTDDTVAQFAGGDLADTDCTVAPSAGDAGVDGELILTPAFLDSFSGSGLSGSWDTATYGTPDTLTVSGDVLTIDNRYVGTNVLYSAPRVLEFVATFGGARQHIGLGTELSLDGSGDWALCSTGGTGDQLYARTFNDTETSEGLGNYLNAPHRYRIEWTTTQVTYFIDGTQVAQHTFPTISQSMAIVVSDAAAGTSLVIDWARIGGYPADPATCVFTSRVLQASTTNIDWTVLNTTTVIPTGTSLAFETRSGNTAVPDGTWSTWAVVTGGAISSPNSEYIQYRVTLTTTDAAYTPEVRRVVTTGVTPTAVTLTHLSAQANGLSSVSLLLAAGVIGLGVIGAALRRRRR